jgi:hypothetical protein
VLEGYRRAGARDQLVSGRVGLIIEGYSGIAGAVESGSVKLRLPRRNLWPSSPICPPWRKRSRTFRRPAGKWIIRKVSEDLRKVVTDPDLKKKIATRGSYTRAMLPAEAIAFVQAEQRKWKPVLELIANKTN